MFLESGWKRIISNTTKVLEDQERSPTSEKCQEDISFLQENMSSYPQLSNLIWMEDFFSEFLQRSDAADQDLDIIY